MCLKIKPVEQVTAAVSDLQESEWLQTRDNEQTYYQIERKVVAMRGRCGATKALWGEGWEEPLRLKILTSMEASAESCLTLLDMSSSKDILSRFPSPRAERRGHRPYLQGPGQHLGLGSQVFTVYTLPLESLGFPGGSVGNASAYNAGDLGVL